MVFVSVTPCWAGIDCREGSGKSIVPLTPYNWWGALGISWDCLTGGGLPDPTAGLCNKTTQAGSVRHAGRAHIAIEGRSAHQLHRHCWWTTVLHRSCRFVFGDCHRVHSSIVVAPQTGILSTTPWFTNGDLIDIMLSWTSGHFDPFIQLIAGAMKSFPSEINHKLTLQVCATAYKYMTAKTRLVWEDLPVNKGKW